jgi:hypothetical protein
MLADECFELGRELGAAPQRQVRVDPLFEREQAALLESLGLGSGEAFVQNIGERGSTPELERGGERRRGRARFTAGELFASLLE